MIYKLQRKFINICILAFLTVFMLTFATVYLFTYTYAVSTSDNFADLILNNDEKFPSYHAYNEHAEFPHIHSLFRPDINAETEFTTRFFILHFNENGQHVSSNTESIAGITAEEAIEYGKDALASQKERGWLHGYRYKTEIEDHGATVIFINNDLLSTMLSLILKAAAAFLLVGGTVFLIIVIIFSKRAVQPVADSYAKQKQFITNANHELKTPLTLILTNTDILESDFGKNEWLDDIRCEGEQMTQLINQMIYLARMDETPAAAAKEPVNLTQLAADLHHEFRSLLEQKQLSMTLELNEPVVVTGDFSEFRQLFSVLMENAIKHCDPNGHISVSLRLDKHPVFSIENTYAAVSDLDLHSLFERFYRADRARTSGSGFGIGLAIAKSIADKYNAAIRAENRNNTAIRFVVEFQKPFQG